MSVTTLESRERQYSNKVSQLHKELTRSIESENSATKNANKATLKIQKNQSSSQLSTATRELNRQNTKISNEKNKQASIQKKISDYTSKLNGVRIELAKERDKNNKKMLDKMERDNQEKISKLVANSDQKPLVLKQLVNVSHDVFISYAHEDSDYANELVKLMKASGIDVIYDKNDLKWGESIIDFIDSHLKTVKFAIVLISPAYLEKYWTNYELKSLLQRHSRSGDNQNIILPIWHNITAEEVANRSLALTDFNAVITAITTKEEIVKKVEQILK